jgi:3',5'-cyclic AMP phosphodiesterase CpdA
MKIALAADLHFGSVPEGLAEELRTLIDAQKPDVVVIAGDLTLRARRREFEQARVWLSSFDAPTLVLPGNHDLPYFNLVQRFRKPFHRYRHAANGTGLMPVIERADGMVLGFNTTRSWQPHLRWQEGTARLRDIEAAKVALSSAPADRFKAVAAHHPLMKVPGLPRAEPVRRAKLALSAFAESGVDLVMSGHIHQSYAVETEVGGWPMLAVGAPTALSSRKRGEANGFWMIEAGEGGIDCTLWLRDEVSFQPTPVRSFPRKRKVAEERLLMPRV